MADREGAAIRAGGGRPPDGGGDEPQDKALLRFQAISAYLALEPTRGQRRAVLEKLAARVWTGPDGEPRQYSAETIRSWVRRYRRRGLKGLVDKPRPRRGSQALSPEVVELACRLKREVPERSLDRLITILEGLGHVEAGTVRRSTLHRALQAEGLSQRHCRVPDVDDLDRFEADTPNDLWQSDMLAGPWLPDPQRPGQVRRAYLYAFLDDHSRQLLHGRFSFKGDLPALELVFRRALQKYGVPRRVYYDNGQVYRSHHMRQIVATLGVHRLIFTQRYRPMGHGKIEAFNRFCRAAFLAEIKASTIRTLDELNEAFVAWIDVEYNTKTHSETGEPPRDRWRAGIERVRYADDEVLRQAFLWKETRSADKTGLFSLFGVRYQVSAALVRQRFEVRYDPERLEEVELWKDGRFVERARPFEVQAHRRPRAPKPESPTAGEASEPVADWLGHLVGLRRKQFLDPAPPPPAETVQQRNDAADQAVVDLLREHLDDETFDERAVRDYLRRFGPFDPERARRVLARLHDGGVGRDHHVALYLDALRAEHRGDAP